MKRLCFKKLSNFKSCFKMVNVKKLLKLKTNLRFTTQNFSLLIQNDYITIWSAISFYFSTGKNIFRVWKLVEKIS